MRRGLLVWAVLLAGCSGSSSPSRQVGSTTSAGVSSSAATASATSAGLLVLASAPQAGEVDVRIDAPLLLTFSEPLEPASLLPGVVELRDDAGVVGVSLQLVTPTVVEVTPAAWLAPHTRHLLRVTPGVQAASGARLAQDHLIPFTTGMPRVTPGGQPAAVAPQVVAPYVGGAAAVDITPPVGVPLAGYGGGDRRHTPLPDLNPLDFHTFLEPSAGIHDPILAKALVLGNGADRVCLLTLDMVATDAELVAAAWQKAQAQGFSVPLEQVLACASHTHSGPGATTHRWFWQLTAADLYKDAVFQQVADGIARALVAAERAVAPVVVGVVDSQLTGVTYNRRAADSPALDVDSVDPELLVIRVDRPNGDPVATVWNYAIHGTLFRPDFHDYSADVMGSASARIERQVGGVALFLNGAEGDLEPLGDWDSTGQALADAVVAARARARTEAQGIVQSVAETVDLGQPRLEWSPQRGGQQSARLLQSGLVQGLQQLGFSLRTTIDLPRGWVERAFRFQVVRLGDAVIASLPGEPIHELGLILKRDGQALGFRHVLPACLANGHGSYFTTEVEYGYGGYEGLASLFGPKNGEKLLDAARALLQRVR